MAIHEGLLTSAARTADVTSKLVSVREKYEAAHVVVDVTAGTGFNLTVAIKGKDTTSNKSYTLLSSIINSTGTTVLRVGPGYTAAANIAKDYMPADWYVDVTASGNQSVTYSIGASLI